MKTVLICLLFGLALSYNAQLALLYAQNYCNKYNPNYNDYHKMDGNKEAFNFISQCLKEGGVDFTGCEGLDDKGMITDAYLLQKCLLSKGWKKSAIFAPGYPIFSLRYSARGIIISVSEKSVRFCAHGPNRCNSQIMKKLAETYAPPQ